MKNIVIIIFIICSIQSCISKRHAVIKDLRKDWFAYTDRLILDSLMQLNKQLTLQSDTSNIDWDKNIYYWEYLKGNKFRFIIYHNTRLGFSDPYIFSAERWKMSTENDGIYLHIIGKTRTITYEITKNQENTYLELVLIN